MQDISAKIHELLIQKKQTLATAESCTGGLLSYLLTNRSGSSNFFILGTIVYSNFSKHHLLKIPLTIINKYGAVSRPVALALAQNIRRIAKADYGLGITGIAGPNGGTPKKPVGTVFIAINSKNKKICQKFTFKGNRNSIRKKTALKSLKLLKLLL